MDPAILVIDDDEVLGQVLSRVLARPGVTVCRATTVDEALQVARRCRPRLALLDLCLPDGDGVQLARHLRTERPDVALILMTAYPLRLHEEPAMAGLFQQVLMKPLNVQELRQAVDRALDAAAAQMGPAGDESAAETAAAGVTATSDVLG
jgi:two-component system response regulator PilR (NtrC family)